MELISSLIGKSKQPYNKIKRCKYDYNETIARHVWHGIAMKHINEIELNNDSVKCWQQLIKYVFGDESCEYDLNKSIAIIGKTGSGKSITMEILRQFINIDQIKYLRGGKFAPLIFTIISAKQMVGEYSKFGYPIIDKYSNIANLCIDDLGSENLKVNHFGSSVNVIEELIENRYLKSLFTHYTSNLKLDKVREMYGDRVYSRINHSCNIIIMNDKDYRMQ
jgi:DNA replication protein DnaC